MLNAKPRICPGASSDCGGCTHRAPHAPDASCELPCGGERVPCVQAHESASWGRGGAPLYT
jgi:hypothetical protein